MISALKITSFEARSVFNHRQKRAHGYFSFFITICDAVSHKTPVSDSTIVPLRESFSTTHEGNLEAHPPPLLACSIRVATLGSGVTDSLAWDQLEFNSCRGFALPTQRPGASIIMARPSRAHPKEPNPTIFQQLNKAAAMT